MGNPAGVRRDFAALEARRMEAARLLREGLSQSAVARELGVHRQSVSRWARELGQSGVRVHEDHVWRILRKLGWSCQRPTGRALERDEAAIRKWKKVEWPRIKKKRSASGVRWSSSTKAD